MRNETIDRLINVYAGIVAVRDDVVGRQAVNMFVCALAIAAKTSTSSTAANDSATRAPG